MISAHGDTPFHDDPSLLQVLGTMGGVGGFLSFLIYWFTH